MPFFLIKLIVPMYFDYFHRFVFFMLLCLPIWSLNNNVSIGLSSPNSLKPLLYTQLNTEETVILSLQTNGSYLFSKIDSSGNFTQSTKNYSGTRSFQQLQGLKNGNFAYIWQEPNSKLYVQVYDNNMSEIGSALLYKSFTQCCSDTRIVKKGDGGFSVFYYDIYSGHWQIFMQSFNGSGTNTLTEVALSISGESVTPGPIVPLGSLASTTLLFFQDVSQTTITLLNSTTGAISQPPAHLYSSGSNPNIALNSSSCQMKSGKIFLVAKKDYAGTGTPDGFYSIMFSDGSIFNGMDRKKVSSNHTFGIYTPRCNCLQNGNVIVAWGLANASSSGDFSYYFTVIDPNGLILHEIYVFDTYQGFDDFIIESFADSSFFIAAKDTNQAILNIQYYTSDLQKMFVNNESCPSPKIISNDKSNCFDPITDCLTYFNNGSCQTCVNSKVVTNSLAGCASAIDNCTSYSDDSKCETCENNFNLTVGKIACANTIANCGNYSDDKTCSLCINNTTAKNGNMTCESPQNKTIIGCLSYSASGDCSQCNSSTILTLNALNCSKPIENCQAYFDNNTCSQCINNTIANVDKTKCISPISDCIEYCADETCCKCNNSKVPSSTNKTCVSSINSCSDYSDNGSCLGCSDSKQVSNDQTACVSPIADCTSITVQATCLQCSNGKIQSYNKTACVISISSCRQETDDSKCLSCLFGIPSINQTICQANSSSTQELQAKIATDTSNNSAQNTNFLSKDQNTTIELVNNLNTNYTMGLDKPYIVLSDTKNSIQVSATSKPSRKTTNGASITASLGSIPTGNYKIQMDVGFTKTKKRLLADTTQEDNLPDYFMVSYDPPVNFFVGSDKDIETEYAKITNGSKPYNLSVGEIIGIVFSIFGFLTIVGIAIWLWERSGRIKEKRSKDYNAPDQIFTSPIHTEKN